MAYFSEYHYITLDEFKANYDYESLSDLNIVKYISKAEKLIDLYVGKQNKFLDATFEGEATGGDVNKVIDDELITFPENYFTFTHILILSGNNAGEERFIAQSLTDGSLIVDNNFTSAISIGDVYKIEQKSQFPREIDFVNLNNIYYKFIPKEIRYATALQTEWLIKKGLDFIRDGGDKFVAESMGAYSYQKAVSKIDNLENMICPEARPYLNKFRKRIGKIIL